MTDQQKLAAIRAKCVEFKAIYLYNRHAIAGWEATIAAIDLYMYSRGFIEACQINYNIMGKEIIAAWEGIV